MSPISIWLEALHDGIFSTGWHSPSAPGCDGGFNAAQDIRAITVNRWGHGYAYGFNPLYDEEHVPGLNVVGRKKVGRISIAGSDAAGSAYAHAAMDEAYRAVDEIQGVFASSARHVGQDGWERR